MPARGTIVRLDILDYGKGPPSLRVLKPNLDGIVDFFLHFRDALMK